MDQTGVGDQEHREVDGRRVDAHLAAAHRTPKHRGDGPMMTGPELFDVWQLTRRPAEFRSEFMDSQFLSGVGLV